MSKATSKEQQELDRLKLSLSRACEELEFDVRSMFGCDAFFRNGSVFGLIWKTGRIGLKIPNPQLRSEFLSFDGASLWKAGNKTMKEWVLIPNGFERKRSAFRHWSLIAYALAASELQKRNAATRKKTK